jgi:sugar phosphate isomerase/epimerase
MRRREFTATAIGAPLAMAATDTPLGIDLFSIRSSGYSPFEYLDYAAKLGAKVVHFSEIRFLGSLEDDHLKKLRAHADRLGVAIEAGMRSICPASKAFDPKQGSAAEQIIRMIRAAKILGSPFIRCFLGTLADRPIEPHIGETVAVLRQVRPQVVDAGLKIAIENHAGDMQGRELKMLIEAAGKDFVGAVIDSGNPLWALEDPHVTLETLAPYGLTSHVRDSAVWRVEGGVAVAWTRMGEGNVAIDEWVRKYRQLCPGKPVSLEIIVTGRRVFPIYDPKFWEAYQNVPAWNLARFLALAEKGRAVEAPPAPKEQAAQKERDDLEASAAYTRRLLA